MSNTKIKAGQFSGIVSNGTDGYFLMTNGDGTMAWQPAGTPSPTVTSVTYPGDDTAADPAGGQSVTLTGTNFATGATVTIGGTTAPTVSFVSATELTITTPAKAAGDYDIVVTNTDGGTATFVDGISYNGIPSWTTASGSLGTFASDTTISTITLQASEPDAGTITFNITSGALPTGLSLTGADIDGTTSKETADTLYNFTVTAIDDENQSTPRAFSITVEKYIVPAPENFEIVTYTGNGGTQAITSKIGKAASFNGSSSKIYNTNINVSDSFSMSIWFNAARIDSNNQQIFTLGWDEGGTDRVGVGIDTDNPSNLSIYASNSGGWLGISNSISVNTWHHLVIAYDNTVPETKCYLDGSLAYTDTRTITNNSSVKTLALSTFGIDGNNATVGYFEGKLDQFRLFNKALSTDNNGVNEIDELYNETYASSTKSTTDIFGDGSGVALYELDGDANSSNFGQAAVFNGSSSYISLGTLFNTNVYSFSFWVNPTTTTPSALEELISSSSPRLGYFQGTSGELVIYDGSQYGTSVNNMFVGGSWVHVCIVANNTTLNVYKNGVNVNTQTITGNNVNNLFISKHPTASLNYFDGSIDQVRIYSSALSSGDVTNLYNELNVPTSGLVAHYKLDGNATDETGSYDGTETSITYSAGVYGGTPTNVNFLGMAFQPDLIWIKDRSGGSHFLHDSVRGINNNYYYSLISNATHSESVTDQSWHNSYGSLSAIGSNGFTVVAGSDATLTEYNRNSRNYVAWCWKAGGAAVTNTDGTIASQVSSNPDAGFSIVSYTGNNSAGATVGHGLSSTPEMVIVKNRTNYSWAVRHINLDSNKNLYLNATVGATDLSTTAGGGVGVLSSSTFGFISGSTNLQNVNSTDPFIAYCFHSVDGYQKVGSYTGNGSTTGTVVTLGFRPRFLMIKIYDASAVSYPSSSYGSWYIFDSVRSDGSNPVDEVLYPNLSNSESSFGSEGIDFNSDGFQIKTDYFDVNANGNKYIYLAIA